MRCAKKIDFGFPVNFVDGIIEQVKLNIPWKQLKDNIIKIDLKNITLVLKINPLDFQSYLMQKSIKEKIKMIRLVSS